MRIAVEALFLGGAVVIAQAILNLMLSSSLDPVAAGILVASGYVCGSYREHANEIDTVGDEDG